MSAMDRSSELEPPPTTSDFDETTISATHWLFILLIDLH